MRFFDSNVLIAAVLPGHTHHERSSARLIEVLSGGGACGSHSLAEMYSTLSNYPRGYGVPAHDAVRLIEQIPKILEVIALDPEETLRTIYDSAQHGIRGPMIYDALLIACARKAGATKIYTGNVKHFCRIAPDLTSILFEP